MGCCHSRSSSRSQTNGIEPDAPGDSLSGTAVSNPISQPLRVAYQGYITPDVSTRGGQRAWDGYVTPDVSHRGKSAFNALMTSPTRVKEVRTSHLSTQLNLARLLIVLLRRRCKQ
jgi:hypothetical protein